jgi:hypothetical protein
VSALNFATYPTGGYMAESCTITFGSEQYHLRLNLLSRPYANSVERWDQNAIETLVTARTGVFQARMSTFIWPGELERLRAILMDNKERPGQAGKAVLELRDSGLELSFAPTRNNWIDLHVTIRQDLSGIDDARLSFTLGLDQSNIASVTEEIEETLRWFPTI